MEQQQQHPVLHKGLKNRHIQLIALGGSIGTGLFLGTSQIIHLAGPAILLGYAICGVIAFLIMRQLAEMVVEEPAAGSFSYFANQYWSPFAGFISGWNYWALYILVSMAELTAVGIYIQYWWPTIPTWASAAFFFVIINLINFSHVRLFGELEFSLAIVKVVAIIAMIAFGGWLLFSGHGGPQASISNLWQIGGFFPHGITALVMASAAIMFSFGGLELVGITAAEADNPRYSIPKATNQIIYRILLFYIGSLLVLLSLYPWNQISAENSFFVMIFHQMNENVVANVLNVIVLTAALSVYNSAVYSNSRMLFSLAQQGNAPRQLQKTNRRGVPVSALLFSAAISAIGVLINYVMPKQAFLLLMSLVVSTLVINWAMISLTHLIFRRAKQRQGQVEQLHFKALCYPFGNLLCLAFMAMVLVIMAITADMRISVLLIPVWLVILVVGYWAKCWQHRKSTMPLNASR